MNIRMTAIGTSLLVSSFMISTPVIAATVPSPKPSVVLEKSITPATSAMDQEPGAEKKVEYTLPYPGILPDHPLYFLKRLRDQILEKLIVDPVRKVEFYMLQADKSMNTAVFLEAKQKETLVSEAVARGQKFFSLAIQTATEVKAQGKEMPAYLIERFTNAGMKYEEILMEMAGKATDVQKSDVLQQLDLFRALQQKISILKN